MRTIILCGGRGMRLREMTDFIPKGLIKIGSKPILYHIIDLFMQQGFKEFDLACGYKKEMIDDYIKGHKIKGADIKTHDTGVETETADRVKIVNPKERFFLTYGDDVSNIDLQKVLDQHLRTEFKMTISGAKARSKWGIIRTGSWFDVKALEEKPVLSDYVNCGYWIVEPELLDLIEDCESTESWCDRCARQGLVGAYFHNGFWYGMNTYKDYEELIKIWKKHKKWDIPQQ